MKLHLLNPQAEKIKSTLFFSEILAVIIVVLWIGLSVYDAFSKTQPDKELDSLLKPLNPVLNVEILRQYKASRITVPEQFQITVVETEGREVNSYTLNPFTNTSTAPVPVTPGPVSSPAASPASATDVGQ
jgi:hypothetical protein